MGLYDMDIHLSDGKVLFCPCLCMFGVKMKLSRSNR